MLADLIDDILDITKIEAGKLEVDRIPCSPWQILADVAALMQVRADAQGTCRCRSSAADPLPETVLTDPTRLRPDSRQPGGQRREVHRQPARCAS